MLKPRTHRKIEDEIITTAAACQLLMLSRQRINQLATEGWIDRHAPGLWRTFDLVQGYVRFLREGASGTAKNEAENRVLDARAHEIEVRTAERLDKLVPVEGYQIFADIICGAFRAELSGLPARYTHDLVQSRSLEREIHSLLERVEGIVDANAARLTKGGVR